MFKRHNCKQLLNSTGAAALTDHITLFSPCYSAAHYIQNNGVPSFLFHKLTKWEGETYRAGHFLLESQSFEAYESKALFLFSETLRLGHFMELAGHVPKGLKMPLHKIDPAGNAAVIRD